MNGSPERTTYSPSPKNKRLGLYLIVAPFITLFLIFILFIIFNAATGLAYESSIGSDLDVLSTLISSLLGFLGVINLVVLIPFIVLGAFLRNKNEMTKDSSYDERSGREDVYGDMPDELKKWNWGAAGLTWIWGVPHGLWASLWIIPLSLIPFINIIVFIIFGLKGNQWAWQSEKWESPEHFIESQKEWEGWGIAAFILSFIFSFFLTI